MADETLSDAIDWKTYEVAAGLASGHVPVRIGTVGNGSPVGVLIASVHGDEGPSSTIAINRMLGRASASELIGTLRVVPVAHPLGPRRIPSRAR
jgi:predicted deacylase